MTERDKKSIVSALKVLAISVFCVACIGIYLLFCFLLAADSLNYGEYRYIGKIILATVLVASAALLALALFGKTGKVKKVIALIACAVLIASFFPLLDVTDKLCAKPYTEFSPENWNRTAQIHPNLLQYMVPDLEENIILSEWIFQRLINCLIWKVGDRQITDGNTITESAELINFLLSAMTKTARSQNFILLTI